MRAILRLIFVLPDHTGSFYLLHVHPSLSSILIQMEKPCSQGLHFSIKYDCGSIKCPKVCLNIVFAKNPTIFSLLGHHISDIGIIFTDRKCRKKQLFEPTSFYNYWMAMLVKLIIFSVGKFITESVEPISNKQVNRF